MYYLTERLSLPHKVCLSWNLHQELLIDLITPLTVLIPAIIHLIVSPILDWSQSSSNISQLRLTYHPSHLISDLNDCLSRYHRVNHSWDFLALHFYSAAEIASQCKGGRWGWEVMVYDIFALWDALHIGRPLSMATAIGYVITYVIAQGILREVLKIPFWWFSTSL